MIGSFEDGGCFNPQASGPVSLASLCARHMLAILYRDFAKALALVNPTASLAARVHRSFEAAAERLVCR
eukprot:COSAG02_NODE_205_length_29157_cov_13.424771_12_plen_69_part_00